MPATKPHTVRIGKRVHRCRTVREGRQYLAERGYVSVTGRGRGQIWIKTKTGALAYID